MGFVDNNKNIEYCQLHSLMEAGVMFYDILIKKYCSHQNEKYSYVKNKYCQKKSQSVTENYAFYTLCIVGNPTASGPLQMCNYWELDNRLWEKAKDKMHKATKKTLCCYSSLSVRMTKLSGM